MAAQEAKSENGEQKFELALYHNSDLFDLCSKNSDGELLFKKHVKEGLNVHVMSCSICSSDTACFSYDNIRIDLSHEYWIKPWS